MINFHCSKVHNLVSLLFVTIYTQLKCKNCADCRYLEKYCKLRKRKSLFQILERFSFMHFSSTCVHVLPKLNLYQDLGFTSEIFRRCKYWNVLVLLLGFLLYISRDSVLYSFTWCVVNVYSLTTYHNNYTRVADKTNVIISFGSLIRILIHCAVLYYWALLMIIALRLRKNLWNS